ncbi:MAG: polysaccharide ABC transporter ATP-binding protein [Candidatus Saganbacteria bacterium]|nr:polysaccharide ABC transporter ATP-binding protein [Candidatus Saganbacteria bacterium]
MGKDTVIKVENLGKKYIIGHQHEGRGKYVALRDVITEGAGKFFRSLTFRRNSGITNSLKEDFWALKEVGFEVKQGERIGIIGRNGAGKSTLLKVLSRITEPTTGRVLIKGRVASLLEVGTGFHPELTGRENIYLNGAVLGMKRSEIRSKFDEIVAFAEVEKFLDTPVKRYSSGMYVRLAFAVAAHLEPEILIVDEVLAVGDAAFREKCLGKMREVAGDGRTVLFVSHSMQAVEILCERAILLDEGRIILEGEPSDVIQHYLGQNEEKLSTHENADFCFPNDPEKSAQINSIRILDKDGQLSFKHDIMNPIKILLDFELRINYPTLFVECVFYKVHGVGADEGAFLTTNYDWDNYKNQKDNKKMMVAFPMLKGKYSATINIDAPLLNAGTYEMEIYLTTGPERQDTCRNILFEIGDSGSFASVVRGVHRGGFLAFPLKWEIKKSKLMI